MRTPRETFRGGDTSDMQGTFTKLGAACLVALSLAACNSPGERAGGGAVIGGLAGAGIGGLAGGGRGALIGGLAGAGTGAIIGAATTPQPRPVVTRPYYEDYRRPVAYDYGYGPPPVYSAPRPDYSYDDYNRPRPNMGYGYGYGRP